MVESHNNLEDYPDLDADLVELELVDPEPPDQEDMPLDPHASGERPIPVLSEEREYTPNPNLIAEGWERRFITDPTRSQEVTDVYTEMGYEVHIEPLAPAELGDECSDCQLVACNVFFTVYTRKMKD